MYGTAASLALHKNLVIVNAYVESKALIALDKATGKEVWRNKEIGATWASPILVPRSDGKQELVLSQPGKVVGYDPENGKELWRCQGLPKPEIGGIYNTPVAKDDVVYAVGGGAPGQQAIGVAVRAGGRGDVNKTHVLWRIKAGSTVNSPVVQGDYLYYIDIGFVNCLRLDTGKVVYKERFYETPREYPSPVVAGDKIFMLTRFDGLFVLSTGGKFEELAHNSFPDDNSVFNASPAFSNGRIYIRSNAYLYCIGKKPVSSQVR
jgi:outer membrane protein assembly factor BamB